MAHTEEQQQKLNYYTRIGGTLGGCLSISTLDNNATLFSHLAITTIGGVIGSLIGYGIGRALINSEEITSLQNDEIDIAGNNILINDSI